MTDEEQQEPVPQHAEKEFSFDELVEGMFDEVEQQIGVHNAEFFKRMKRMEIGANEANVIYAQHNARLKGYQAQTWKSIAWFSNYLVLVATAAVLIYGIKFVVGWF